jgi:hypothetical protein
MSRRAQAIAIAAIVGVIGLMIWQRPNMAAAAAAPLDRPAMNLKIADPIEPDLAPIQPPAEPDTVDDVQHAVLYEEDPSDPIGKQTAGSVVWRTEEIPSPAGEPPELTVRADIELPERRIGVTWMLRRATDDLSSHASHTIEIIFKLPPDFPAGGVSSVPGVLMKQSERARGVPLAAVAVKVTEGFFMVGLSAAPADKARNIDLLKQRPWLDIPIVYADKHRAILTLEKGAPGERAIAQAFADWEKQ